MSDIPMHIQMRVVENESNVQMGVSDQINHIVDENIIRDEVDNWLDEHPEATTTVQDESLTPAKLASKLKAAYDAVVPIKAMSLTWERGNINTSGANANSSRYVRTASAFTVDKTPLYVTFDGSYSTASVFAYFLYAADGTFISKTNKRADTVFTPEIGQKVRFLIYMDSGDTETVISVANADSYLQAGVETVRNLETDKTLESADRPADAKAVGDKLGLFDDVLASQFDSSELENGKYNTASAGTGSSAASCLIGGETYTLLGVRSKHDITNGYINNVDMLVSRGSVYMYVIGVNSQTKEVLGWYNANNGNWSILQNNIVASQKIDVKGIINDNPSVRLKLCIVDISTTAQISAADVVNAVDVYYVPSREQIGSMSAELEFINPKVPSYYDNMLTTKEASILANMEATGRHGFTFAFLTDLHWDNNAKNSPVLLHHIMEKVGLTDVICGGDLIAEGTREYAEGLILDCIDTFKRFGITFPVAYGNHDGNWNPYNDQREHPERRLDESAVWALMESQFDKYAPVYYTDTGFNFYIDYPVTDTRLIFVDTGDTRDVGGSTGIFFTEWESYADALMAAGNKNIIVISHAVAVNSIGTNLCIIANSYNARTEHHSDVLDYDFTDAQGHVYVVIGGHGHSDVITTPASGGISWVMTDTDSTSTNSAGGATIGTTTEQAFDVVTVDYTTGGVRFVRIGRGEDREIEGSE